MKISVVIPTYNSCATIAMTIDSVLHQTIQPDEILVLDDGSTDNTVSLLSRYQPRVTLLTQKNRGVAHARNVLSERAGGDLVAFLDHDDVWHPAYLEMQARLFAICPHGAAFFTGHVNFKGCGSPTWGQSEALEALDYEIMESDRFMKIYNQCPGPFGSMSFCCIPKRVLTQLGSEPFPVTVSGADDFYLFNVLPLMGPVLYAPAQLVAYRLIAQSQSNDQLKSVGLAVRALELISKNRRLLPDSNGANRLNLTLASKRRHYAKLLLGAGRVADARAQLKCSLSSAGGPMSLTKSLGLLLAAYLPAILQPRWLAGERECTAFPNGR